MRTSFVILLSAFLLFAISCGNPKNLVYQDVRNFTVQKLSLTPEIGMDIQFYNPNNFGLTMKDADINVYMNDKFIGNAKLTRSYKVPGLDTFLLPVTFSADLQGVISNAIVLLSNKEVDIKLQGNVKAGKGVFVNVPVNYRGKQKLNVPDFK
jgi:LEA14-like dessication related protein